MHRKKDEFAEKINKTVDEKSATDSEFPKCTVKVGSYCQVDKLDVVKMGQAEKNMDDPQPYYSQKIHVSLDLKDGDHEKIWNEMLLEIVKNPCVAGAKVIHPNAPQHQPGKEVTLYFIRPDWMIPPTSLPSYKREQLKVIKMLDDMVLRLAVKPSMAPVNGKDNAPEWQADKEFNSGDKNLSLGLKSASIYMINEQDGRGGYVKASERVTVPHTFTGDVLDHYRRDNVVYSKLDYLISRLPLLDEITKANPDNQYYANLVKAIRDSVKSEDTQNCIDRIEFCAIKCLKEPEKKQKGKLFSGSGHDPRIKDLSALLVSIKDPRESLISLIEEIDKVLLTNTAATFKQ